MQDDNITVVTAYFNIGNFSKGYKGFEYTPAMYHQWMLTLSLVRNPMIAFVDNDADFRYMMEVRSRLPSNRTLIIKVSQSEMSSFSLVPGIAAIFNKPGYPTYFPNTVEPRYSAAMHAKYEVMRRATTANPFRTSYFCWLDVGLFRELIAENATIDDMDKPNATLGKSFLLELPFDFHTDSIAYTEVWPRNTSLSPREIVYTNSFWVCGCFFVGETELMRRWTIEYANGLQTMLNLNLASTDQQLIYYIFNHLKPRTKIRTYHSTEQYNPWFHLGFLLREEGLKHETITSKSLIYNA